MAHHHSVIHLPATEEKKAVSLGLMLHLEATGHKQEAKEIDEAFKFSNSDPGWAEAFTKWMVDAHQLKGAYEKHTHTALGQTFVYPLFEKGVAGVVGDWGTGNSQSKLLADRMVSTIHPDIFIHMGDVYYAGTGGQFTDWYTKPLLHAFGLNEPSQLKGKVWTLSGNHDCEHPVWQRRSSDSFLSADYGGGVPFFKCLEEIGSHPGSYFSLENSNWGTCAFAASFSC
jgi:hypothetical protein